MEKASAAGTAILEAETEANRASARLVDTRSECGEQHKAIAAQIEAVRCAVRDNLHSSNKQPTVQPAKVHAMGNRMDEMKKMLLQSEWHMEVHMTELNTQMNALSAAAREEKPKPDVSTSEVKVVPSRTTGPPLSLKTSTKTVDKAPRLLKMTEKTARVHVCAPSSSSATLLLSLTALLTRTQDRGVDPITLD